MENVSNECVAAGLRACRISVISHPAGRDACRYANHSSSDLRDFHVLA
jgi:hypothetical protein